MKVVVSRILEYFQATYNQELLQKDMHILVQAQKMILNFMEVRQLM